MHPLSRWAGGAVRRGFNTVFWPIGRKEHRCEWCYEQIEAKEQHAHYIGVWNGEFQNWRMHEECFEDYDLNRDGDGEFMPGEGERPAKGAAK